MMLIIHTNTNQRATQQQQHLKHLDALLRFQTLLSVLSIQIYHRYQDRHHFLSWTILLYQETMPEWPPLILDQANNLLVSFFIQGVNGLFLLMHVKQARKLGRYDSDL